MDILVMVDGVEVKRIQEAPAPEVGNTFEIHWSGPNVVPDRFKVLHKTVVLNCVAEAEATGEFKANYCMNSYVVLDCERWV
jgi:hypothetical protein